eukprot:Skav225292  [mRNA]  locus=scaffold4099:374244:377403:+ [translate_table: standard]
MTCLILSSWIGQERRHQLIDALSKSQRTRCLTQVVLLRLKTCDSYRSHLSQAAWDAARQADASSPRGTAALSGDSPGRLSCSWADLSAPKQTQAVAGARLPGQVLAGTKSRTCAAAARHFQAFKLNLSREGLPKSPGDGQKGGVSQSTQGSNKDKFESNPTPRLPGRVLEDTLSRTCAAAFLTHEPRLKPVPAQAAQGQPKGRKEIKETSTVESQPLLTPRCSDRTFCRREARRSESPRRSYPLSARMHSPREKRSHGTLLDTLSSQERLPRPTMATPVAPAARRKTIAATAEATAEPQIRRSPRHTSPGLTGQTRQANHGQSYGYPSYPHPPPVSQSELGRGTEIQTIRAGTPSVPIPLFLGTSLPSWARTEAGLSPSRKKLASSAAMRLQRAFRTWWFRNFSSSGPTGFRALRDAVIYLQRWWRLAHARRLRRLHLKRCWKKFSFHLLVLQDAASCVQRGWHMVKVRRWRCVARQAANVIQQVWRQRLFRLQSEKLRFGMAKFCSWQRRFEARARLIAGIRKFWQVQHDAAVCVQSLWRGREVRRMFALSRERLERARDRREIIRRKAQLLDTKQANQANQATGPTFSCQRNSKTFKLNSQEHICQERSQEKDWRGEDQVLQDRCQDRAPFRPAGPAEDLFHKVASTATPRDGRGMQSRSKRLSYGQSRIDTGPRSARTVGAQGPVSVSTFLASQNALSASSRATPSAQSLVRDLTSRGCLSMSPRMSPFSPELSGHSDLEAVRSWLSGTAELVLAVSYHSRWVPGCSWCVSVGWWKEHCPRGRFFKFFVWSVVVQRQRPTTVSAALLAQRGFFGMAARMNVQQGQSTT